MAIKMAKPIKPFEYNAVFDANIKKASDIAKEKDWKNFYSIFSELITPEEKKYLNKRASHEFNERVRKIGMVGK